MLTINNHPKIAETNRKAGVMLTVVSAAAGRMRLRYSRCRFDSVRVHAIEDAVGKIPGVRSVQSYPRTASLVIRYSPAQCDTAAILSAIADIKQVAAATLTARAPESADTSEPGAMHHIVRWAARTLPGHRDDPAAVLPASDRHAAGRDFDVSPYGRERLCDSVELRRAAWSGTLLTASALTAWITPLGPVSLGLKVLALAVGASTFVPASLNRLSQGRVGVDTLTTTAALGAVGLGQIGDVAKTACLSSMSTGFEQHSAARTRRRLRELLSEAPDQATVLHEGKETVVNAADLRVGDEFVVRPGERLATDGVIRVGCSALHRGAIIGGSAPLVAKPGDAVFAGSTNGDSVLIVEVTATAANNSLARLLDIVEAERILDGADQQLADRTARPLVAGLVGAAVLVAVTGSIFGSPAVWIKRALMLLATGAPYAQEAVGIISGVAADKMQTLAAAHRPTVIGAAHGNGATSRELPVVSTAPGSDINQPVSAAVA